MTITKYTNAWKNCATCEFWGGARKLNDDKTEAIVTGSKTGICGGFWKGSRKYPNDKCSEWRKWPELDEWSGEIRATYP